MFAKYPLKSSLKQTNFARTMFIFLQLRTTELAVELRNM